MQDGAGSEPPSIDASIDLSQSWEVHYWTETLGVTRDQLERLIRENGPLVAFVRKALDQEKEAADSVNSVGRVDMKSEHLFLLGHAVVSAWGILPRDVQETLFARAVEAGQQLPDHEAIREELAQMLHDHHPRTASNQQET